MFGKRIVHCSFCSRDYPFHEGIVNFVQTLSNDLKLSHSKWSSLYRSQRQAAQLLRDYTVYKREYFPLIYDQINEVTSFRDKVYLEIGCGPFYFGQLVAKECKIIIGVDISREALTIARRMLEKNKITNYLLIQADILQLPITDDTVDIIFGGGVIEHFKDTRKCLDELYRVLRKRGTSFNTVPMLNIGSLTYRQVWGNIPNAPLLKQIAEFIHIKLLQGKHMRFGYELSFLPSTMARLHRAVGFRRVTIDNFRIKLVFEFAPRVLRPFLIKIATDVSLFWPMIKVIGTK